MAEFSYQPNEEDPKYEGDEALLKKVKDCFKRADQHSMPWRREAKEAYAFVAGDQWAPEDEQLLKEQLRPIITFNRTGPIIDAVAGSEVNNRQEVRYLPRTLDDSGVNEMFTEAARWVRDLCDAEDEESDAFTDCLICGMGWTETRMDYEEDLDGQIVIDRVDPMEMWWDPDAKKRNLSDARWLLRAKRVTREDLKAMWPDKEDEIVANAPWDRAAMGFERNANDPDEYASTDREDWDHASENRVRVIEYQWWERKTVYRVAINGQITEFDSKDIERLKSELDRREIRYVKQTRKVFKRAFIAGEVVLEKGLAPCDTDFTFKPITGKRDRNKNYWYGLVRSMKDPQRWANKFYSQILHIINTNAKGGIMAEENAVEDWRDFEKSWARADGVTKVASGAMGRGAIQPKPTAPYPTGLDRMMELAMTAHYQTTGVNLEMLGMADRTQPGVLEYQRRQAGLTILATLFDSLRRYRKEQGRVLLYFIREYISDGRLVRIVGDAGARFVPLKADDDVAKYDIIVDEAATAPNMKERTFQVLSQILPAIMKAGITVPKELLDYTPLPTSLVEKWKAELAKQPQIPEEIQKQLEDLQKENASLKSDMQVKMLEVQGRQKVDQAKLAGDQQIAKGKLALKAYETDRKLDIAEDKAEGELEIGRKKAAAS